MNGKTKKDLPIIFFICGYIIAVLTHFGLSPTHVCFYIPSFSISAHKIKLMKKSLYFQLKGNKRKLDT